MRRSAFVVHVPSVNPATFATNGNIVSIIHVAEVPRAKRRRSHTHTTDPAPNGQRMLTEMRSGNESRGHTSHGTACGGASPHHVGRGGTPPDDIVGYGAPGDGGPAPEPDWADWIGGGEGDSESPCGGVTDSPGHNDNMWLPPSNASHRMEKSAETTGSSPSSKTAVMPADEPVPADESGEASHGKAKRENLKWCDVAIEPSAKVDKGACKLCGQTFKLDSSRSSF